MCSWVIKMAEMSFGFAPMAFISSTIREHETPAGIVRRGRHYIHVRGPGDPLRPAFRQGNVVPRLFDLRHLLEQPRYLMMAVMATFVVIL